MIIFRIVRSLFLIISVTCLSSNMAWAGVCESIHIKLAEGQRVQQHDADSINSELLKDRTNPFKHFVAGEVMVSAGLYGLAETQFEEADRLQKDYVLTKFRQEFQKNWHIVSYVYKYVQNKYPNDPALLLYLARRHLAQLAQKGDPRQMSAQSIVEKLRLAAATAHPWPGTFALLSMLEYNEALTSADKSDRESLLKLSIKHASDELKQDPDNPLALKVRLMSILKHGGNSDNLENVFLHVLKVLPKDPEVNVLLGRAYLDRKDYKSAIQPVLIGLLTEHDFFTRQDSLMQACELARKADPAELLASVNKLLAEPGWSTEKKILLSTRVADMLFVAGKPEKSLDLLDMALKDCPAVTRPLLDFKIGQELTLMHRYFEARTYLDKAYQSIQDPASAKKIICLRTRVALVRCNYHRDIALQIKTLISPGKHMNYWSVPDESKQD